MRRVVRLCSALALGAAPLAGQQALVGISGAVALDSGQRATVPLVVNMTNAGGALLGAYQLQLIWNPAVIRYIGAAPGAFGAPTVNAGGAGSGSLTLAGANAAGSGGVFSVAELTFELLVGTGSSPVTVTGTELTAAATFAPVGVLETGASICAAFGSYGDVNRDGNILANDALFVVTAAVGLPIAPVTLVNADVDSDGDTDTRDALGILSSAVGLPTPGFRIGTRNAPCGGPAAASLALTPGSAVLASGDVLPLTARALDAGGNPTAADGLAWSSSAPGTATVDSTGRVSAVAHGNATISAMTIGGLVQTALITVQDRHVWYVDQAIAAANPVQLGSPTYPFATIQQGVDAAAAGGGDTVRVGSSPPYGPVSITKSLTLLGDSTGSGMPSIRNAGGPAITANAAGRVAVRWFNLIESGSGLDARGDTIDVQSVVGTLLRGPAFRVHNMQVATLRGVSGSALTLAGILIDSTPEVQVAGADFRVIEPRGDSAAGVAIVGGATAALSRVTVFGITGDGGGGAGVNVDSVTRVTLDTFDLQHNRGVKITRARFAGVTNGAGRDLEGDPALSLAADTIVIDGVQLRRLGEGALLRPRDPQTPSPQSLATISNSVIDSVFAADALLFNGVARIVLTGNTIAHVFQGAAVVTDSGPSLSVRGGRLSAALAGGIFTDHRRTVSVVGVEVDSSASPPPFFSCAVRFAVSVNHADSVRLDTLNVHDNLGGGILVDSARIATADRSAVVRNQGQRGFCGDQRQLVGPQPTHTPYSTSQGPGAAFATVQTTRLVHFTADSNTFNGVELNFVQLSGATAVVDTPFFRGGQWLLRASGNFAAVSGTLTVHGGTFQNAARGVIAEYLGQLDVQGARFDNTPPPGVGASAIEVFGLDHVLLAGDTLQGGAGMGIAIYSTDTARVDQVLVRARASAAAGVAAGLYITDLVDSGFVSGSRFERNGVDGILAEGTPGRILVLDGNVVADDTARGVVLRVPATVTNNLFTRNLVGVMTDLQGGPSIIQNNNIEGNVVAGLLNTSPGLVDATNNWWNDALGPRCQSLCDPGSAGDSVQGAITFTPFLTARAAGAPTAVAPRPAGAAGSRTPLRREGGHE